MVGFDDLVHQLMDKLVGGDLDRQVIPIVGMAGIGKTTLSTHVFQSPLIRDRYDVCVWATVSQSYNIGEIIGEILDQIRGKSSCKSEAELGEELHKYLFGRR